MPQPSIPILNFIDAEELERTASARRVCSARRTQPPQHRRDAPPTVRPSINLEPADRTDGSILCYQGRSCGVPRSVRKPSVSMETVAEPITPSAHVIDLSRFAEKGFGSVGARNKHDVLLARVLGKSYRLHLGSSAAQPLKVTAYAGTLHTPGRQPHAVRAQVAPQPEDSFAPVAPSDASSHIPKPVADEEWTTPEENRMHDATPWRDYRVLAAARADLDAHTYHQTGYARRAFAFMGMLVLLALPIYGIALSGVLQSAKGVVLGESEDAAHALTEGVAHVQSLDFARAATAFARAAESFYVADTVLRDASGSLLEISRYLPGQGSSAASAHYLFTAGTRLSDLAATLAGRETLWAVEAQTDPTDPQTLGIVLMESARALGNAAPVLREAVDDLAYVDARDLPFELRAQFIRTHSLITALTDQSSMLAPYNAWLYDFLGFDGSRRYLVLFENDAELRATGGFTGSFALVDVNRGIATVVEMPPQGTYAVQGQLVDFVASPDPLHLINSRWEFQDANWFPDFPASAKKAASFYERAGGPTVDGVIAFTPAFGEKLLDLFGPLELNGAENLTVTSDNFRAIAQRTYDGMGEDAAAPKQILVDLVPAFFAKLSQENPRELAVPLARMILEALKEKYLLLYAADPAQQARLQSFGWAGDVRNVPDDYLMAVISNIGGEKVDRMVLNEASLLLERIPTGMRHTLTLKRTFPDDATHTAPLYAYVRVYVPHRAQLVRAEGFQTVPEGDLEPPDASWGTDPDLAAQETVYAYDNSSKTAIGTSFGKTFFGNWMILEPGHETTATLVYETSVTNSELQENGETVTPYTLFWQKQPGARLSAVLALDAGLAAQVAWRYPQDGWSIQPDVLRYAAELTTDRVFGFFITR